ncbi:hypothetical protein ACS0TY_007021 [Phlomoides rotata]
MFQKLPEHKWRSAATSCGHQRHGAAPFQSSPYLLSPLRRRNACPASIVATLFATSPPRARTPVPFQPIVADVSGTSVAPSPLPAFRSRPPNAHLPISLGVK